MTLRTGPHVLSAAMRILRVSTVVLACVVLFALIQGAYKADFWANVSSDPIPALVLILGVGGVACASVILWDIKREARKWSVTVSNDEVQIVDEAGITSQVPLADLRLVIAATGFSLWRGDVSLYLFDDGEEALVSFPLLATGAEDFLVWLSNHHGYQHGELAKAQASTRGGAYLIWVAG